MWLERQHRQRTAREGETPEPRISLVRILQRDLIGTTIQTSAVIAAFMFSFYSMGVLGTFDVPSAKPDARRFCISSGSTSAPSSAPRSGAGCPKPPSAVAGPCPSPRCWVSPLSLCALHGSSAATLWIRRTLDGGAAAPEHLGNRSGYPHGALSDVGPRRRFRARRITSDRRLCAVTPIVIGMMQDRGIGLTRRAMTTCT